MKTQTEIQAVYYYDHRYDEYVCEGRQDPGQRISNDISTGKTAAECITLAQRQFPNIKARMVSSSPAHWNRKTGLWNGQ